MTHSSPRLLAGALSLALGISLVCRAQGQTAEEVLASAVAEAKTGGEGAALLDAKKELVSPRLIQALAAQANRLALRADFPRALAVYRLALDTARAIKDDAGAASALYGLGQIYNLQDNFELASKSLDESLELRRALGDRGGMGAALNQLGVMQSKQGNYERALQLYGESLPLVEEGGNKIELAGLMNNIGNAHNGQGVHEQALKYYGRSLALADEAGSKARAAVALSNIGLVHSKQGNYALAVEAHRKSLAVKEEQKNRLGIAVSLINLGDVYRLQGNHVVALEFFGKALRRFEEVGARQGVGNTLNNIGQVHQAAGDFALAADFHRRALKQLEEIGDKVGVAESLNNLGAALRETGRRDEALEFFRRGLAQSEEVNDRPRMAESLNNIAGAYLLQNRHREALQTAARAAAVAGEVGGRESIWRARTIAGKAHRALGEDEQARQGFVEAVEQIEAMRAQISGGERERQSFFEDKISPYHEMVELLAGRNNPGEALAFAERAKGRVLLDVLQRGRANVTKSMTEAERGRERELSNELASLNAGLARLRQEKQPDARRLGDLEALVQQARLEYESFTASLYAAHPELRLKRGEARILGAGQAAELLDARTALLEYVVTEGGALLFVLTKGARGGADLRLYRVAVGRKDLASRVGEFRRALAGRDPGFAAAARGLYDLLVAPARAQLRGRSEFVVVPDDSLWELPFQALRDAQGRFLVEQAALSYAPSLSVLREIRGHRRPAPRREAAAGATLLAFGNPSFGKLTLERARVALRGGAALEPLPEAENEVKSLARLYGAGHSRVYTGAEAREGRAKEEAGNFSVLHFATHGVLNDASPMYSHVVLSQGDGGEDGLLEAWEIMKLDLRADLVVLSACETARGRVGAGEGMIGLTWAMFVAGSPSTLVSQWKVDSAATKLLMLDFHRGLGPGAGPARARATKSGALRLAALKMMRSGDYRHPFYWAGFVVVGDSR